jgi:hypothetical protein
MRASIKARLDTDNFRRHKSGNHSPVAGRSGGYLLVEA